VKEAAQELTSRHSLEDLFTSFAKLHPEDASAAWHANLTYALQVIARGARDQAVLVAFAKVAESNVDAVVLLAGQIFSRAWSWATEIVLGPLPGDLPAVVYEAAGFRRHIFRPQYLLHRVKLCTPAHTSEQLDLAHVLAPTWVGTLPTLCATLNTLRPVSVPSMLTSTIGL
jgi:hypothetical protein